jgi:hypothetical protein
MISSEHNLPASSGPERNNDGTVTVTAIAVAPKC